MKMKIYVYFDKTFWNIRGGKSLKCLLSYYTFHFSKDAMKGLFKKASNYIL